MVAHIALIVGFCDIAMCTVVSIDGRVFSLFLVWYVSVLFHLFQRIYPSGYNLIKDDSESRNLRCILHALTTPLTSSANGNAIHQKDELRASQWQKHASMEKFRPFSFNSFPFAIPRPALTIEKFLLFINFLERDVDGAVVFVFEFVMVA